MAVPFLLFGTSRGGSTGPSPPPAGAVSLSGGHHLVWRRGVTAFGPQRLKERAVTSCVGSNDRQNDAAGDAEVLRAKGRENADRCGQGMELAAPGTRLIAVGN